MTHNTSESTDVKQLPAHLWKPGQSGNPLGRPKGSKNALGEAFVAAMHDDFQQHGIEAIQRVREKEPAQYLRVIASIIPKEVQVTDATLGEMSDDELISVLAAVRALTAASGTKAPRKRAKTSDDGVSARGQPH